MNEPPEWWQIFALIATPFLILWGRSITPDEFDINSLTPFKQHAWNISAIDSVVQTDDDAVRMFSGGTLAVQYPNAETQFKSEVYAGVPRGEGLRFSFRTTKYDFQTKKDKGISFVYSPQGSYIEDNGKLVKNLPKVVSSAKSERVYIENNGAFYWIIVGCDTVAYERTHRYNTDFIIFESLQGTTTDITKIAFEPSL